MDFLKYRFVYSCFAVCLIFTGCKSLNSSSTATEIQPVPETFADLKDSSNSAAINWREYFSDSTLAGLIDTAMQNNQDLLIALQRIEASRSNVLFAKGMLLPEVSTGGSVAQRKYGLYTMDGAGNITTEITPGQIVPIHLRDYFIGLQSSWEADVWGKLRNRKKAAMYRYLSSVEGKNLVVTNLVADIAAAYYELLAVDNELDIIRETIQLQENALSIVKIQKEAGAANELAVKQFEAQVLDSKALEKETLQRIIEAENRINFLLGRYPQRIYRNKTDFNKPIPVKVHVGVPSDLLKNRPDIRQAEYELIASKADVKAAKAAFYPSLNIVGTYGFQSFRPNFLFSTPESVAYTLLGSLSAPLINRSAIKAEFRYANASQQAALYSYQQSILNGYVEVYNEVARIRNLNETQELKSRGVEILTESIETSSQLFRTGRASYLEVLITQRSALDSKLELTDIRKRQYFTVINLYKALGGGWQ